MKQFFVAIWAILLCLLPAGTAFGATYTDDMSTFETNRIKSFGGLTPVGQAAGYPRSVARSIPGGNAVTLASLTANSGWVEYQVQNAASVTVGIYTWKGTFVSTPDGEGYALGIHQDNMAYLASQQLVQAQFGPATGSLYLRAGGSMRKLADIGFYFAFLETAEAPANLIDYGVNVYAGTGQGSLARVPMPAVSTGTRLASMQFDRAAGYCYEQFTYPLPSGTTCVRIEINDYTHLDVQQPDGSLQRRALSSKMRTTLSFVSFTGSALIMGRPEPESSLSSDSSDPGESQSVSSSSSSKSASSSKAASSSKQSSAAAGAAPGSSAASSGAASKFQGQITSPQPSGSGAPKAKASASDKEPAPEAGQTQAAPEPPPEPEREPLQIMRVEQGGEGKTSFLLALYIAGICGLIFFLLLGGRGR